MSISPEVQQELKEIFCTLSDTGSQHGIMCGTKLVPAASSLGVTLKPTTVSYYDGEKKNNLNFETFVVIISTALQQDTDYLQGDVLESFNHFDPSRKGVCESGEIHRWLNLLGEHVDLYEVEKQILSSSNAGNDEDGTGETISRDKYAALVAEAPLPFSG